MGKVKGQQINVEVSAHQLDGRRSYRSVGDRMLLLDDKNLVVTETLRTSPPALSGQVSLSVPETTLPSIDLQSDLHLSDSEVARSPSTAVKEVMTPADRSECGLPAMNPIRFDGSGGGRGGGQQMDVVGIRTELDALPGYHLNVRNRSSSIKMAMYQFRDIDGAYIVRSFFKNNDSRNLEIALAVMFHRRIRHYHIHQRPDELSKSGRRYFLHSGDFHASTIHELLRHYTTHPLDSRPPPQTLAENDTALTQLKLSRAIHDR